MLVACVLQVPIQANFEPQVSTIYYDLPTNICRDAKFGRMAISQELYVYMCDILPEGSTVLELGSGYGTGQLAKHFSMHSIEHDSKWVGRYNSSYIYAPVRGNWYSVEAIKKGLPEHYDLILIDGPPRHIGRRGFINNLDLFDVNVPLIFDDTHLPDELQLMIDVARKLKRNCYQYICADKKWGVIFPSMD